MSVDHLIRKLGRYGLLTEGDCRCLTQAASQVRSFRRYQHIAREDGTVNSFFFLLEGWAARSKLLHGGRRSLMSYLIPGDACGAGSSILERMDHSIIALTDCTVAVIPIEIFEKILEGNNRLNRAFRCSAAIDKAIMLEWIVNLGQRDAGARIAHLFCEMFFRCQSSGFAEKCEFAMPVTQLDIGNTLGMTINHVNRTIKRMRDLQMIDINMNLITIKDLDKLKIFANFKENYLHL